MIALPTKWRLADEKGQVFRFDDDGKLAPTTDVMLTWKEVEEWRHAVSDATAIIKAVVDKNRTKA